MLAFYMIALAVAVVDQTLKSLVRLYLEVGQSAELWNGAVLLTHYENSGAARSSFQGYGTVFMIIGLVVIAGLLVARRRGHIEGTLLTVATAVLLGGAAGNTIDRMLFGKVTDYLVAGDGIMNAADLALSAGAGLMLLDTLWRAWRGRGQSSRHHFTG
ncbi:signal peptidase II [Paenibacillus hodogayensis]|uniref:Lipoprotein signal peptidase n=1 Tax=Paenibacillus hodogayensis TaxID=279208 RepID=A0ABV5VU25_9BACL